MSELKKVSLGIVEGGLIVDIIIAWMRKLQIGMVFH